MMQNSIESTSQPSSSNYNYASCFEKSDKTDAILVVQGNKMHVNKALLSYHSDYFNTLFNSDFKEKWMDEIFIEGVDFEAFATLLSWIHERPIFRQNENAEKLVELADRFLMDTVMPFLNILLLISNIDDGEKMRIAAKYHLGITTREAVERMLKLEMEMNKALDITTSNKIFEYLGNML